MVEADLAFLAQALLIGAVVAAPVGPLAMVGVNLIAKRGYAAGLVFGAGVAAADALYAGIAALGIAAVAAALAAAERWLPAAAALVLAGIGAWLLAYRPHRDGEPVDPPGGARAFATACALALAYPPNMLFFAGVYAAIGAQPSVAHAALFAAGVFCGSLACWAVVTRLLARGFARLTPRALLLLNRTAGAALIAYAGYVLWRHTTG